MPLSEVAQSIRTKDMKERQRVSEKERERRKTEWSRQR